MKSKPSMVIRIGNQQWSGVQSILVDDLEEHSVIGLVMENGATGSISQSVNGAWLIDVGTGKPESVSYGRKLTIAVDECDKE